MEKRKLKLICDFCAETVNWWFTFASVITTAILSDEENDCLSAGENSSLKTAVTTLTLLSIGSDFVTAYLFRNLKLYRLFYGKEIPCFELEASWENLAKILSIIMPLVTSTTAFTLTAIGFFGGSTFSSRTKSIFTAFGPVVSNWGVDYFNNLGENVRNYYHKSANPTEDRGSTPSP